MIHVNMNYTIGCLKSYYYELLNNDERNNDAFTSEIIEAVVNCWVFSTEIGIENSY